MDKLRRSIRSELESISPPPGTSIAEMLAVPCVVLGVCFLAVLLGAFT
jgi:hypothetical protein